MKSLHKKQKTLPKKGQLLRRLRVTDGRIYGYGWVNVECVSYSAAVKRAN